MLPMTFHRKITKGVKLAIRERLKMILQDEEDKYNHFIERVSYKLTATRRSQVERSFKKRIQAIRITIYILTPMEMRDEDVPVLFKRKGQM